MPGFLPQRKLANRRVIVPLAAGTIALILTGTTVAKAAFDIQVVFDATVTPQQQSIFNQAASTWESLVTGYQPGISISSLVINASVPTIDGAGGILGQAGPTDTVTQGGFTLATAGIMQFDSADVTNLIANGSFSSVILHEMAHVMGFGTLWTDNGVYVDGNGRYTGANALAAYKVEYAQQFAAAFVPVELGGGSGTANGHWDEVNGGGGNTGIVDFLGRDKRFELMTGWLNSPAYISNTTIQSFRDIGYTTVPVVIPEPGTLCLTAAGLLGIAITRRRSKLAQIRA